VSKTVYANQMQVTLNVTVAKTVKKKLPSFGLERSNVRKLRP
jgi:hypothetical protein